ncbi:putative glycosyltransferase EpsH [Clostridium perfringens]|uniref:glycosyltransferase family 2 protein n=1 Tax=Clostridium perfringens TaxID=1502 RepID=UPI002444A6DE|nr:glycosyltransferase family 2 protein [Clostridium perfringens]MDG6887089.1 putative glycosyltransferase EpsH [Clostridium perfringens]
MYKISVLVPVYNTEKTLQKCMDSILNQSIISDIEIVIVNDGSTDNSEILINEYLDKYKNIVYFKQKNQGLGATRNQGIRLASSEYIAFLDSDDWVDFDYYENMYNLAKKEGSDLVISSYCVEIPSTGSKDVVRHNYNDNIKYLDDLIKGDVAGFSWNKLYKKSLITENDLKFPLRGYLENVEDQYFSFRCVALSKKISFYNGSNIHYMINPKSIVRKYQKNLYNDILNLYNSDVKFLKDRKFIKYDIDNLKIILIRGIITTINNEFKPEYKVSKNDKIKLIKNVISIKEYKESLNFLYKFNFRKIDKLYLNLIIKNKINLLYALANMRCKYIHYRSGIYKN